MADGQATADVQSARADAPSESEPALKLSHYEWLHDQWEEAGEPGTSWVSRRDHLFQAERAGAGLEALLSLMANLHRDDCGCISCQCGEATPLTGYLYGGVEAAVRSLARTVHIELATFREAMQDKATAQD
jgi:hypothetical protein